MNSAQRLAARLLGNIRVATGCKSVHMPLNTATNRKVLTCVQNPKLNSLPTGKRFETTSAGKFEAVTIQDGEDFKKRVVEASDTKPVFIFFHVRGSRICTASGLKLEAILAKINGKVAMAKVDVDDNFEAAKEYDVLSFPTVIAMKNRHVHSKIEGVIHEGQIRIFVDKVVAAR